MRYHCATPARMMLLQGKLPVRRPGVKFYLPHKEFPELKLECPKVKKSKVIELDDMMTF